MDHSLVFEFSDYKKFLSHRLDNSWGLISRAAEAAGCQRSYLSRVLNGAIQLTPDHAYNLAKFFKLSTDETDYFLLLLEVDRASSAAYRKRCESKLSALRTVHDNLSMKLNRSESVTGHKEVLYYSAWYWSAIHIMVSIPAYRTSEAISKKLQLPVELVEMTLNSLVEFKLLKKEGSKWAFASTDLHVPKDSPLVSLHHMNWRNRAVLDAQMRNSDSTHYSVVQSMDRKNYERIKQLTHQLIEEGAALAGPAKEEMLVCFAVDFFEV